MAKGLGVGGRRGEGTSSRAFSRRIPVVFDINSFEYCQSVSSSLPQSLDAGITPNRANWELHGNSDTRKVKSKEGYRDSSQREKYIYKKLAAGATWAAVVKLSLSSWSEIKA